jgi:hypothetical protein
VWTRALQKEKQIKNNLDLEGTKPKEKKLEGAKFKNSNLEAMLEMQPERAHSDKLYKQQQQQISLMASQKEAAES